VEVEVEGREGKYCTSNATYEMHPHGDAILFPIRGEV
jgi:hypothetical protein